MPPSFYMWSPSLKQWAAIRDVDVALAHEIGFFVIWWPLDTRPNKTQYNRIFDKEYHLAADDSENAGNARFRDIKEG